MPFILLIAPCHQIHQARMHGTQHRTGWTGQQPTRMLHFDLHLCLPCSVKARDVGNYHLRHQQNAAYHTQSSIHKRVEHSIYKHTISRLLCCFARTSPMFLQILLEHPNWLACCDISPPFGTLGIKKPPRPNHQSSKDEESC